MKKTMRFDEVLEAVEKMPLEDQESLLEILERRRLELRRAVLARESAEARKEFRAGKCSPRTPAEILKEVLA